MAETKFTPGPWDFVPDQDNTGSDSDCTHGSIRGSKASGRYYIARIWSDGGAPEADARLIAAAPALVGIVHRLCISLASAGVEAKAGSLNPLEALHADALAAYEAATGDGNPFATALAGICADNRAALASGESPSPEEESRG